MNTVGNDFTMHEDWYIVYKQHIFLIYSEHDFCSVLLVFLTLLTWVTTASTTSPLNGRKTMALYLTGYRTNPLPGWITPAPMLSMVVTAITKPYLKQRASEPKCLVRVLVRTNNTGLHQHPHRRSSSGGLRLTSLLTFQCMFPPLLWTASVSQCLGGWDRSTEGGGEFHAPKKSAHKGKTR